jgi:Fe2+ or Zn2+ uptake regulation protein
MARPSQLSITITQLLEKHHVLSAKAIGEKLLELGQTFNKTSIYRALEKLQSQHTICQHNFTDNTIVYELANTHHDHLVCTRCGLVAATECQITTPINIDSFAIDHHHATWFGTCKNCQHSLPAQR